MAFAISRASDQTVYAQSGLNLHLSCDKSSHKNLLWNLTFIDTDRLLVLWNLC